MAKPRVFVSSTYYDLKHIRASLENFIESLGFEAVLFERGDIAFTPDAALDQSCYREVGTADIFVLVIGNRYGSAASSEEKKPERDFFEKYNSITKEEYAAAIARDIPVYILVEAAVHSEYQTYRRNRDKTDIAYAHVDSVNIFKLLDAIFAQQTNNPVHTFERFADIEGWLREQWAGRFREFLHQQSEQKQLSALSDQVAALKEANKTLAKYLEVIVTIVSPENATELIEDQQRRLAEQESLLVVAESEFLRTVTGIHIAPSDVLHALRTSESYASFVEALCDLAPHNFARELIKANSQRSFAPTQVNAVRLRIGKPPFPDIPTTTTTMPPPEW